MKWTLYNSERVSVNPTELGSKMLEVFRDGFGIPRDKVRWSADAAADMVRRSTLTFVLTDDDTLSSEISGYACYVCPGARVDARHHLLWEDGICIQKRFQKTDSVSDKPGWGAKALANALSEVERLGQRVRYLGGRTQHPGVISRYAKFGITYPLDEDYSTPAGMALVAFLLEHIDEVKKTYHKNSEATFDRRSGIFKKCYSEGRLGDYLVPTTAKVKAREARLSSLGFDRDRGDAVVVVAQFDASQ